MLTSSERARYSRHLLLPQLGEKGQVRLKSASVLVVGAGGLGSPVLMYLAAAGVGRIGIVDFDTVDASNLQRQILYGTEDVGSSKLECARKKLEAINPLVEINLHNARLSAENALEIIGGYDVVADGTDNFATRYLINDACVLTGTPNAFASIYRFDGQASVFATEGGPCYRCLFPEPPPPDAVPSCAEGGVLGVLPGILGTLQATEVIKVLTGIGESLSGRLLTVDALTMDFKTLSISRDSECVVCGDRPSVTELIDYDAFCSGIREDGSSEKGARFAGDSVQTSDSVTPTAPLYFSTAVPGIDVFELQRMKEEKEDFLLLDVREAEELTIADIGGQLLPMGQLTEELAEIAPDKSKKIVVMCRSGARSAQAVKWMQGEGFENAFNLEGGILSWSRNIDSSIAVY